MPFFYTCLTALLTLFFSTLSKGSEQRILAQTILAEARGDGRAGMYAVAACIKVRAQKRNLSFKEVCLQPWQFSCWNKNDPNRKKMVSFLKLPQARYALRLSTNMKKINTKFIGHANHYMTIKLWRTGKVKWAKGKKHCAYAGSHEFYKLCFAYNLLEKVKLRLG